MNVEQPSPSENGAAATRQHKTVPRWLRMSLRVAFLIGVVSVPALAVKEPSFTELSKYKNYSMVFMVLGTLVLPIWEPNLGNIVVAFTMVIPIGYASLWLAYGLFVGCSNIIFMMGACVVVTFIIFFFSELLSLPVSLLSVFATIFVAAANTFVQTPPMAMPVAALLSVMLLVAAFLSTLVSWLLFPEFCVDEVFRHHHEGLEHILHLAHYVLGRKPPALLTRIASSSAATFGQGSKWRAVLAAADELPDMQEQPLLYRAGSGALKSCASAAGSGGSSDSKQLETPQVVERSWHRVHLAFEAGQKAQLGAKAEVVLVAAAHKRMIIPCSPLLPCSKGQMDEQALLALRHVAVATCLQIYKLYSAAQPLDDATQQLMEELQSSSQWTSMCDTLLAALQELVDTFPMDYYPSASHPDQQHLRSFLQAVDALEAAWNSKQHARQHAAGKDTAAVVAAPGRDASHMVDIPSSRATAGASANQQEPQRAAVLDVFKDPLVPVDSPAAAELARLNVLLIVRMLGDLAELLQQLYDITAAVSDSLLRFKCC